MKQQIIVNIAEFMGRATLKGSEVPAYLECMQTLEALSKDTQQAQTLHDAAVDARDMPSGATKQPDQFKGD